MDFPVGIIGAGPAGTAAAIRLSLLGISCLLVDRAEFPREKVCGDAISGKVTTLLHRLDPRMLDRFRALPQQTGIWGIRFTAPNGRVVDLPFPPGGELPAGCPPGFVCPRRTFDHFLHREAVRRPGIRLMTGQDVCEFRQLPGGGWHLGEPDLRVRLLLDAGGAFSTFSRRQAGRDRQPQHYAVSMRAYCRGLSGFHSRSYIELHLLRRLLPGYMWIFPLPGGRANVGIGLRADQAKRKGIRLRAVFDEILHTHPRLRGAQPEEPPRGYGLPLGSRSLPLSGEGYMLLGDAAQLIDPLSGEGIGNAVYSGILAAEQAAECFRNKRWDASFLQAYDQRVARVLGSEMKLSKRLQKLGRYPILLNGLALLLDRRPQALQSLSALYTDLDFRKKLLRPGFWLRLATKKKNLWKN